MSRSRTQPGLLDFEGLIFSTAARYADLLDDDLDDIRQVLRVKVWKALEHYDPARSALDHKRFIFGCMRNFVKDLLKSQDRRNKARGGRQQYITDVLDAFPYFEELALAETADEAYFEVEDEDVTLPATLTPLEREVVALLVLDYNQTEISEVLGVPRKRIVSAHAAIREKMEDWRPDSAIAAVVAIPRAINGSTAVAA